ncbi:MAG: hypothetical protein M3P34_07530 [Actinomycetota bacterium]|nr:hypothetical protein [Actinomycetota bacterium]
MAGRAELLQCLSSDPCWDAQVEDRSLYYGTLGHRLGLTAAELALRLDSDDDRLVGLLHSVLYELALRGDDGAIDVLVSEFRRKEDRAELLRRLAELDRPDVLERLRGELDRSFDEDDLVDAVRFGPSGLPWDRWAAESPKVRRAVVEANTPQAMSRGQDFGWRRPLPKALLHRFRTQLTTHAVETLRSAANALDTERGQVALAGLEVRRDPSALELAASAFQRSITGRQRAAALRYIRALDPDVTLPLARSWIEAEDDRADAAAVLFRLHAEARDVGLVREALARSWATRDMYNLCDLIDALGRHTDLGPFDELVSVFEEVEYSYARRRAVAVLSASDKTFADRYGVECLWDCEAPVRIAGARIARLDAPSVRERIEALAVDPYEDQDVIDAARHRLDERSTESLGVL